MNRFVLEIIAKKKPLRHLRNLYFKCPSIWISQLTELYLAIILQGCAEYEMINNQRVGYIFRKTE